MAKDIKDMKIQKTKFIGKFVEAKETITFKFEIPKELSWEPGTHFHLAFTDFIKDSGPDINLVKAFSIMSTEDENYLGFTTRIKEDCSIFKKRLMELKIGDEMLIFKVGNRMELRRENRPLVFISMGVGIATFRPLIKQFKENSEGIKSITSINIDSKREFVYKNEVESVNKEMFVNHYVGSRQELYEKVDKCLAPNALYYIVGSDNFLRAIIEYLKGHSISKNNIIIDKKVEDAQLFL
jgi:ferredoxin--NADP+ reductase